MSNDVTNIDKALISNLAYRSLVFVTIANGFDAFDEVLLIVDNLNNNEYIPNSIIIEKNK